MSKTISDGLVNLNGHMLCSIDWETTGLTPGYHDGIEIAIIPVDADLRQSKTIMPFTTLLRPKDRYNDSWTDEAARAHKIRREELMVHGVDPWKAADRFEEWAMKLELGPYKKIAPLAYNWPFDRGFLLDWLGPKTFDMWFWHRYRDALPLVLALNDRAEMDGKIYPFPQTALQDVRSRLGIAPCAAHRAVGDALVHLEVYRNLMTGTWFRGE